MRIFITLVAMCSWVSLAAAQTTAPATAKVRIVLAGDSTVTDNAGWGSGFAQCFDANVKIINLSKGGRSSGSFVKEGRWQQTLDLKPDFVLVQFGHNDQPGHGPERETDPATTYKANMLRYVEEGRAAGIKVILVTSLSRRQWGEDDKIHSGLAPYVDAVKEIAKDKNVPLIDLHAKSIELYEKLGRDGVIAISPGKVPSTAPANGDNSAALNRGYDGTHLNAKGGAMVGPMVAAELVKIVPDLEKYLKTPPPLVTVAADGSGDYRTLQEAINAAIDKGALDPGADRVNIYLKPGTYEGPFVIPKSKTAITLIGEDAKTTKLTYARNVYETIPPGIDKFNPCLNVRGNNFAASRLTIENTSGDHGQALAVRVDGDRAAFRDCRMLGWQDTLMTNNGRQYYKNCYIEGRVDFIYGSGTAVFEQCQIHSKNGGYVTAANTPQNRKYGFVFLKCKLTGDETPWNPASTNPSTTQPARKPDKRTYLGRPWREFAAVAFINCEMGDHITPEGWHNWGKPASEKTSRYMEYNSTGPGANPSKRVAWAKQLTKEEAAELTPTNILSGEDNWRPADE